MKNIDKILLIKNQLRKSEETIEDAKLAFENKRYRNTLNRIYYAIFYTVCALAIKYDFATSKHKQLMGWFNKNFIKEEIIDRRFGEIYKKAYDNRQESDYDVIFDYDGNIVQSLLNEMEEFFVEIKKVIEEH